MIKKQLLLLTFGLTLSVLPVVEALEVSTKHIDRKAMQQQNAEAAELTEDIERLGGDLVRAKQVLERLEHHIETMKNCHSQNRDYSADTDDCALRTTSVEEHDVRVVSPAAYAQPHDWDAHYKKYGDYSTRRTATNFDSCRLHSGNYVRPPDPTYSIHECEVHEDPVNKKQWNFIAGYNAHCNFTCMRLR